MVAHGSRNADPTRFGQPLHPRRDVHPVAENVLLLNDHLAEIDAHAKPDAALLRHLRLAVDHPALDLHGAADGIHHARKLRQEAVAGVFHNAPAVLRDLWIDQFAEVALEPFVGSLLVRPH